MKWFAAFLALASSIAVAQDPAPAPVPAPVPVPIAASPVQRGDGMAMAFDIGYGIKVNEFSTLRRQWVVVNDPALPITFKEPCGPRVSYVERRYRYTNICEITSSQPVTAFELRTVPISVLGNIETTLSATEVRDLSAGQAVSLQHQWNEYSDNDASNFHSSVTFVAAVRLSDGRILKSDLKLALAEVRRLTGAGTEDDLRPAPPRQP